MPTTAPTTPANRMRASYLHESLLLRRRRLYD
jgi:hypothetical protein